MTTIGRSIQSLYRGRLEYLNEHGFDLTVVCVSSELDDEIRARGVHLHTAPLRRSIAPWQDLRALWNLWRFLRRERFDVVEVSTPKAALVGSIAARLAGVPCVIHVLRGLVYEGQGGLLGWILRISAAIPCRLAHQTFSISPSARERAVADGVGDRGKIRVLGSGSYMGVDLQRFSPERRELGPAVRARYDIPAEAVVIGFIGRMACDKGLNELVAAVRGLRDVVPNLVLLLVGDYDERDRPADDVVDFLAADPRVRQVGFQSDVVPCLAAIDILVLPTHREGFGNVLVEAAAMGLPTVTTNATGCRDASEDGLTGFQVPVGNAERLRAALERLAKDAELRRTMGAAGRRWVAQHFDQDRVWALYAEEYRRLAGRG